MREKLIELLNEHCFSSDIIADHLIANGVTLQKWIPVTERLPEENTLCLAFTPYNGDLEWDMNIVCFRSPESFADCTNNATHWMPLPEAPKE